MLLSDAPAFAVDMPSSSCATRCWKTAKARAATARHWQDAVLGPVCYPVYDLAVGKGIKPAYIEFKVIRKPIPLPDPPPDEPLPISPPLA